MDAEQLTERLGKISEKLNGIVGRLCISQEKPIREAHGMAIDCGWEIDTIINELEAGASTQTENK